MYNNLKFFDVTLRDGSHAIKHQLTRENIEEYCDAVDDCGLYTVVVGHGNGLGASSLQVGISLLSDDEMLKIAKKNLKKTKLGAYMIPGFGTINTNLNNAIDNGVDIYKIGCHCTEANTTKQHIEYIAKKGFEVYGILMMYHYATSDQIIEQVKMMESYGAKGVILMDSAGASTPDIVYDIISKLVSNVGIEIGFHAHNNLGLAIGNALTAINAGATIIEGTIGGFGAGAGNCQLECAIAALIKMGYSFNINFNKLLEINDSIIPKISNERKGQESINIISGMNGIFSAFKTHVLNASRSFGVQPFDIYNELGKRKPVAGQEDMVVEIAEKLKRNKEKV